MWSGADPGVLRYPRRSPPSCGQWHPLNVIFEDKHLIVLNKAAGMVVHRAGARARTRWCTRCCALRRRAQWHRRRRAPGHCAPAARRRPSARRGQTTPRTAPLADQFASRALTKGIRGPRLRRAEERQRQRVAGHPAHPSAPDDDGEVAPSAPDWTVEKNLAGRRRSCAAAFTRAHAPDPRASEITRPPAPR